MPVALLLSIVLFFQPAPSTDSLEDLYPLQIGNGWSYDYMGATSDPTGYIPNFLNEQVSDTSRYLGHKLFQISQGGIPKYHLYFDSTTVIRYIADTMFSFKTKLLYWPLKVNESTVFMDTLYDGSYLHKIIFVLKDSKTSVTTRAGSFECYHFQQLTLRGNNIHPDTTVNDLWYAKGTGLVKNRYSKMVDGKQIDQGGMDLTAYKIM
jgi:hypothetical protein